MVRPERFELPTLWFVARYSIQLSYGRTRKNWLLLRLSSCPFPPLLEEREGFEPSMEFYPHTPLAGERLRPLGHLSAMRKISRWSVAHYKQFVKVIVYYLLSVAGHSLSVVDCTRIWLPILSSDSVSAALTSTCCSFSR